MWLNLFRSQRSARPTVTNSVKPTLEGLELRDCPSTTPATNPIVTAFSNFDQNQVQPLIQLAQTFEKQAVDALTGAANGTVPLAQALQTFETDQQVAAFIDRAVESTIQALTQLDNALVKSGQLTGTDQATVASIIQNESNQLALNEGFTNNVNQFIHPNEDNDFVHQGHHGQGQGPGQEDSQGDMNGQGDQNANSHGNGDDRHS